MVRKLSEVQVFVSSSCFHGKDPGILQALQTKSAFSLGMATPHAIKQYL